LSRKMMVQGRSGMEILIEDNAYQIRRCRGLDHGNFGRMDFYHIFDENGKDLTGQARFRYLRQVAEWLVSRLKWKSQLKRTKVRT
jgi:hypothetical protein